MARKPIPDTVEAEVIYNSDRKCCICKKSRDHIHHINKKSSNSVYENLAFLCFDCHHDASVSNGLKKSLRPATIKKFRDEHYKDIAAQRRKQRATITGNSAKLTSDAILETALSAVCILEVEKLKEQYFEEGWKQKIETVKRLHKFSNYSSYRLNLEVLKFLEQVEGQTRAGMPTSLALAIDNIVCVFFPLSYDKKDAKANEALGTQCVTIGFGIAYDAFIWLKSLSVGIWGLMILKHIYQVSKKQNLKKLNLLVLENFDELLGTLKRPERNDLGYAIELVEIFIADLERRQMDFPDMPAHIFSLINEPDYYSA